MTFPHTQYVKDDYINQIYLIINADTSMQQEVSVPNTVSIINFLNFPVLFKIIVVISCMIIWYLFYVRSLYFNFSLTVGVIYLFVCLFFFIN